MGSLLQRLVPHDLSERRTLLLSFAYFFFLLAGYYVLQPLRDELGGAGGVRDLPWLFLASLVVMLLANPIYAKLVAHFPRRKFLPWVYVFFTLNLLLFYLLLQATGAGLRVWVARAFFLWVGVFNLFAVSVFWSFMADIFDAEQAKRLFGFIGAGGTAGQLVGSIMTLSVVGWIGTVNLILLSLGLLGGVFACLLWLLQEVGDSGKEGAELEKARAGGKGEDCVPEKPHESPPGGSLDGIRAVIASPYLAGICLYIFLYTFTSSFLYFGKQEVVRASLESPELRTAFFAKINLAIGVTTLFVQLFLTGRLLERMGLSRALALVPGITAVGFLLLGQWPVLIVFAIFEVVRKAANYALARPAREILYTVVSRTEKYQAKNFIDTFVYRGGDAVAALVFAPIQALGLGLAATTMVAAPVALFWGMVGLALGKAQEGLSLQRG
jgi:AAA family ATP:ADP antiporter